MVLFIIPLSCNIWEEGCKVVKTGYDLPVAAVRAGLLRKSPACYCRSVGVTFRAQPPDFTGFCTADLPGSQGIVFDIFQEKAFPGR